MGDKKTQLSVSIDPGLAEWLDSQAAARMVGKAYLVEAALRALRTTLPDLTVVDVEIVDG